MPNPDLHSAETAESLRDLVEQWFHEAFQNSVVARATDVWNHVHAAKNELQQRLAAFLAETL